MEHWNSRPDEFHGLPTPHGELPINAKYDFIQYFPDWKIYRLHVQDDELGLITYWLEPEQIEPIIRIGRLAVGERIDNDNMYSEKEDYLVVRDKTFGWEHRLDQTVPEPYEILEDGEIVEIDHGED